MVASRLVVQNVGEYWLWQVAVSHLLASGTSGQFSVLTVVQVLPGTHRSAVPNSTRAAAGALGRSSRSPYSIRFRLPPRPGIAHQHLPATAGDGGRVVALPAQIP